jgi:hypothetical protein
MFGTFGFLIPAAFKLFIILVVMACIFICIMGILSIFGAVRGSMTTREENRILNEINDRLQEKDKPAPST